MERNLLIIEKNDEILKALSDKIIEHMKLFTANCEDEAFEILKNQNIKVIVSDSHLTEIVGKGFYRIIKQTYPDIIRLLFTDNTDINGIIDIVNDCSIFRYLQKPIIKEKLESLINEAFLISESSIESGKTGRCGSEDVRRNNETGIINNDEADMEAFFNLSIDFLTVLDETGKILKVNRTVIDRLGYEESELIDKNVLLMHPPNLNDEAMKIIQEILRGNANICNLPLMTKDGRLIPVETRVVMGKWNGIPAFYGNSRDMSDLAFSEEKFFTAFKASPVLMALSSIEEGRFFEVNEAFLNTLGFISEEVIGKTPTELNLYFGSENHQNMTEEIRRSGGISNVELNTRTKSGEIRFCIFSAYIVKLQKGNCFLTVMNDITEMKKSEKALKESEERFRSFVENANDIIYTLNGNGIFTYVSPNWTEILGHKTDDVMDNSFENFIHPDDIPVCRAFLEKVLTTGEKQYGVEYRVKHKNGEWRWHLSNGAILHTQNSDMITYLGIARDITERKKSEEELKESEERLNLALEVISDGMFDLNICEGKIYFSPFYYYILGYENGEIPDTFETWKNLMHPEDLPNVERELDKCINQGDDFFETMYRIKASTGNWHWLSSRGRVAKRDHAGNAERLIGINEDITNRRQIELELMQYRDNLEELVREQTVELRDANMKLLNEIAAREQVEMALLDSKERFRAIYEGTGDAVMLLTEKGYFDCNQRTLDVFRLDNKEKFIKKHPSDLSPPVQPDGRNSFETSHENILIAFKNGTNRFEWVHKRENGETFPAEVLFSQFDYGGKKVLQATVRDITERKIMQENLQKAMEKAENASRTKGEFLANMSHEIRTPMNAIIGFSELLKSRISDEKSKEYLSGILTAGDNLLCLIDDILDLSKIEAGRIEIRTEPANLRSFCKDMAQIFNVRAAQKGIGLFIEISDDLPEWLMLDEIRIRQILLNLIGNAVKFTEKGSVTLRVRTDNEAKDGSLLDIVLEVEDTGIGIPENQQALIFEAFRQQEGQNTRKYGGTGLGLSITKRLVEMMGGKITLNSQSKKGSIFRVHLKNIGVTITEPLPEEMHIDFDNICFNGAKILIAEDIESNRRVISSLLEPFDVRIYTANNGLEALDIITQIRPDLILMDMQMPVMDGNETTRILKNDVAYKEIPIIALTALSMDKELDTIKTICDGYLRKPVTKSKLLKEIALFLPYSKSEVPGAIDINTEDAAGNEEIKVPPAVADMLKGEYIPRWKKLKTSMRIGDIKKFASELQVLGKEHSYESIAEYGERLKKYATTLKIDLMMQTLERFQDYLG